MAQLGEAMQQAKAGVVKAPPKDEADFQQRVAGWMSFLQHPEVQAGLMQFGINATQPMAPGQTNLGHFTAAVGAGLNAAGRVEQQGFEREQLAVKTQQEEKKIANDQRRTDIAGEQVGVQREGNQIQREQLGAQTADNAANRKLKETELEQQGEYQRGVLQNQQGQLGLDQRRNEIMAQDAETNAARIKAENQNLQAGGAQGVLIQNTAKMIKQSADQAGTPMTDEQAYLLAQERLAQLQANPVQMGSTLAGLYAEAGKLEREAVYINDPAQKAAMQERAKSLYDQADGLAASMRSGGGATPIPGSPTAAPAPAAAPGATDPNTQGQTAPSSGIPEGSKPGPLTKDSRGRPGYYLLDANGKKVVDRQGRALFKPAQ